MSVTALMASSLQGMPMPFSKTSSGSELVSMRAMTGMLRRRASLMAFLLALGVDHEQRGGQALEVAGATEVGLKLSELLAQNSLLLLAAKRHGAIGDHALELLHAVDARADGHEVGEHAAEPTLVDVGHAAALSSSLHGLLSLLLGADEQHLAALGGVAQETCRPGRR